MLLKSAHRGRALSPRCTRWPIHLAAPRLRKRITSLTCENPVGWFGRFRQFDRCNRVAIIRPASRTRRSLVLSGASSVFFRPTMAARITSFFLNPCGCASPVSARHETRRRELRQVAGTITGLEATTWRPSGERFFKHVRRFAFGNRRDVIASRLREALYRSPKYSRGSRRGSAAGSRRML